MVLGVDHDEDPELRGPREHLEDLAVVEPQRVVRHEDLDGGVTLGHQPRQLLPQDRLGRIGDDEVVAEPEPMNFSARDWLGAILLEADRPADAEAVYLAALEDHPNNGWSLLGLEQALRAQGRDAEADSVGAKLVEAWPLADHWVRALRY